jgi:hypothetical protein
VRGGERARRAGADDRGPGPSETVQGPRGHGERLGHDRGAGGIDAGAGVHPLADAQRLLRQLVERAPDGAGQVRRGVGRAQLSEDLRLADHHRVQPRRDDE